MVKRVSTRFLDSDSLADCYGWESIFPEDRPLAISSEQIVGEQLPDEEVEEIISPKRRGRPKRPYIPHKTVSPQPIDLGESADGDFAWERKKNQ